MTKPTWRNGAIYFHPRLHEPFPDPLGFVGVGYVETGIKSDHGTFTCSAKHLRTETGRHYHKRVCPFVRDSAKIHACEYLNTGHRPAFEQVPKSRGRVVRLGSKGVQLRHKLSFNRPSESSKCNLPLLSTQALPQPPSP